MKIKFTLTSPNFHKTKKKRIEGFVMNPFNISMIQAVKLGLGRVLLFNDTCLSMTQAAKLDLGKVLLFNDSCFL